VPADGSARAAPVPQAEQCDADDEKRECSAQCRSDCKRKCFVGRCATAPRAP
jgi:hypothetical protein